MNNNETQISRMGIPYWLAKNTKLTSEEISSLCRKINIYIHPYLVVLLKREEGNEQIPDINPIALNILTEEQMNPYSHAELCKKFNIKNKKYIPSSLKEYIPAAIKWMKINHPYIKDIELGRIFGKGVDSIRKMQLDDIEPIYPMKVNLITQQELEMLIKKYKK